ncbi:MAG: VOC family protein [Leptospiraceae bacterium]|nr:VOC family protein [Leptospiraceae bacterium]
MNNSFKPDGYNSLSPYFIVQDAPRFISFLKTVFDAAELRKFEDSDGRIMHAEMKIDDSVIMLGEATSEHKPIQLVLHLYVADVDKIFERAVNAGCEPVKKPEVQEGDPDKRGTFLDFAGNSWSVGMQIH